MTHKSVNWLNLAPALFVVRRWLGRFPHDVVVIIIAARGPAEPLLCNVPDGVAREGIRGKEGPVKVDCAAHVPQQLQVDPVRRAPVVEDRRFDDALHAVHQVPELRRHEPQLVVILIAQD